MASSSLEPSHILPYIPPRTSSHPHRRQSSTGNNHLFLDSDHLATSTEAGPSSPPRSNKRVSNMSATTAIYTGNNGGGAKLPSGAGATRFPFKAKSAYFSSSHTEFQASIAGASPPPTHSTSKLSSFPSPPRHTTATRPKSTSNPEPHARDKPLTIQGNGPFEPQRNFGDKFIDEKCPTWSAEKERILLGPFDYLYGHPGKDIRAQLIAAFNVWLRVPDSSLAIITKVVGMLHTASLLVDDVEDSSLLRRGNPVAHSIFGTAQTINSANYVYFLALQQLTALPHANFAIQIFTEELLNLHRGQGMDLFWRDSLTCPTEDDYLEMVSNKTGGLFRLAIKLMQAESPVQELDCGPLVSTIGLLFQILDDLLNLSSPTYTQRKGLCEDLTEGKFSFPVIHAIRADPENLVLMNVLKQKTTDEEVKKYAVSYMERMGSFAYTKKVLGVLEGKALSLVREAEGIVGGEEGKRGADGIKAILGMLKGL